MLGFCLHKGFQRSSVPCVPSKFYLTRSNEMLPNVSMTSPTAQTSPTDPGFYVDPDIESEYDHPRPVQVFDWRGRHLYDTTIADAAEMCYSGAAHHVLGANGVHHVELTRVLSSPGWIFGTRHTFSVRTEAGMVVHAPRRANTSRIPTASHVRELVEWGASVLPIDRERLAMRLEWPKLAALVLHEAWGYSHDEIAGLLGVSQPTVCRNIASAIATLRKIILHGGE